MGDALNLVHRFDSAAKKHYLNEWNTVLHCHHYATIFTELAISARGFAGTEKLVASAEMVLGNWLKEYYRKESITVVATRVSVAEEYWRTIGMGLIRIVADSPVRGSATMDYSHIDEGWLKKLGSSNQPVNFLTQGFLAGVFSALFGKPFGSYAVVETHSLVMGAEASRFEITLKVG
ncbi:MAG: 4-vinyl reductase [Thermodesulfobacteriota bacterium]